MKDVLRRGWNRAEQVLLRRMTRAPRMKLTRLDLRLDMSGGIDQVRAAADFSFQPQVASNRMTCLIGDVTIRQCTTAGRPVQARVNAPFLVMVFPRRLSAHAETPVTLRYTYLPDQYGTVYQPVAREDCPERVWITCRRPLLGLVQGRLVEGTEQAPLRTYQWAPPRSRKLNAIVADVRSFKKATEDGMTMWLHVHADAVPRAPRLLDLLLDIYHESVESHHRKLAYEDFHVIESDDRMVRPFNSGGLIVVPRGTFNTEDKPTVRGILVPEFTKEWARDPTRMIAAGRAD